VRAVQAVKLSSSKRWFIVSLCAFVVIAAVAAIGLDVMRRAQGMQLADTSASAVLSAPAGTHIKAVMRVEAPAAAGMFAVEILQNTQGADYRETGARIRLALSSGTHFIMGATPDLKPGAIVQADGAMDAGSTLRAAKIVVLNDYVHVIR
jgi:hypothetical protein